MGQKLKKLLSAVSALAVTVAAFPITGLTAIAENETEEVTSESTDYSLFKDDSTEENISNYDFAEVMFDTPMIIAAQAGVTKEEWIHALVTVFDMSIEDETTIESYFTDIEDSPYAYDINLAANYGVFDVESDKFNPTDYVTREFAAHTANFCMGYLDDETSVTLSDSDDIYYEYDAVVSVQKGWFSLSSGKFEPDKLITEAEAENILKDAKESTENIKIDSGAENTIKYSDSVIQIENTAKASYFENTVTITNSKAALKKGSVFVANIGGTERIFKAISVDKDSDGNIVAKVENADISSAVRSIDIQGYGDVDYDNITFYDSSTEIKNSRSLNFNNGSMYLPKNFSILAASEKPKSVSIDKTIDLDGVTITLNGSLSNIQPKYKLNQNLWTGEVESLYLGMSADANVSASFYGEFKGTKSREIPIASVPVICAGIFKVDMILSATVTVSGETIISYGWNMSGGVSYTKNDGWRTTKDFKKKNFTVEAKVSESLALKAKLNASLAGEKIGEAYIMGGEIGTIYGKNQADGVGCVTLKVYVFAEYGANFNLFGLKTFSNSVRFINEKNSPVKFCFHWEDGKYVSKCSYEDDGTNKKIEEAKKGTSYVGYSTYGTLYDGVITLENSASSSDYSPYQTWTESKTLQSNITVNGDLYVENSVDLNGHTLTINGDLVQKGGAMVINSGTLNVNGNYTITSKTHFDEKQGVDVRDSTGTLYMQYANGYVNIKGDFKTYSEERCYNSSAVNYFDKGTMTIYGNFYQYSGDGIDDGYYTNESSWHYSNFQPESTFNLVFSGSGAHEVYFEDVEANMTGIKEENGATIKITGVLAGITLKNDIIVTGDMPMNYGTMNLNGHTLTVNGNLTQKGGAMVIGSGTLNVNGDYTLSNQTHFDEKENETYRDNTGTLYMDNATGKVNIKGDFKTYSEERCYNSSAVNYFDKGTMTIYGGLYQYSGDGIDDGCEGNFVPSDNFNIIFTGDKTHIFSSESKSTKTGTLSLNKGVKVTFKGNLAGLENVQNCTLMSDDTISSVNKNTISAVYPGTGKVSIVNASNDKATINVTVTDYIKGDVNCDGKVTVVDVVLLQKWLVVNPSAFLPCWKTADLYENGRIDVFDLVLLKRQLIYG